MWSPRKLLRLPIELRVALLATVIAFAFNVAWAAAQASWKLDQGTATLVGAIIGFAIVGRQARRGFANLIRAQTSQAELDRTARQHQAELDQQKAIRERENERVTLLSAIRAEIVALHHAANNAEVIATRFSEIAVALGRQGKPPTSKTISFTTFEAPIYMANLSKIGLLGPSLGGDVVIVLSRTKNKRSEIEADGPIPHEGIKLLYESAAASLSKWADDLLHVAMRIRSIEEGWPDPGTLSQTQDQRRAGAFRYLHAPDFVDAS